MRFARKNATAAVCLPAPRSRKTRTPMLATTITTRAQSVPSAWT